MKHPNTVGDKKKTTYLQATKRGQSKASSWFLWMWIPSGDSLPNASSFYNECQRMKDSFYWLAPPDNISILPKTCLSCCFIHLLWESNELLGWDRWWIGAAGRDGTERRGITVLYTSAMPNLLNLRSQIRALLY